MPASAATAAAISLAGMASAAAAAPAALAGTVERATASAGAQLAPCGDPATPPSNPSQMVEVGGSLFFVADDGVHGEDLWKSDGTQAGTVLVKNLDAEGGEYGGLSDLTPVGDTLFFTLDDGVRGTALWSSDGTRAGTALVKVIDPSGGYSDGPSEMVGVGDTLYFTADDGVHGDELWKSDGTKAGTVLVKDITSGDTGDYYSYGPDSLTDVAGTLFFTADDGVHGEELWKSDGTAAGTVLVKDIHPGDYDSDPGSLAAVGSTLFFTAETAPTGPSCGSRTAARPAPCWSRTSSRGVQRSRPAVPHRCGLLAVLHRRRRRARVGAVDVGRQRGRAPSWSRTSTRPTGATTTSPR